MGAMVQRPGLVLHLDTIRGSFYDDDGFLGFQIDGDGDSTDGAPELEPQVAPFDALHTYGFLSRPLDPAVDGGGHIERGALSLTLWEGSRGYSLALHDSRVVPALARCKGGESVQYGPKNNFIRCHDDGRISQMCTDDGTENGKVVAAEHGPSGFTWRGPWGKLTHDALGLHYLHTSGARLDGGAVSGLPAPLDALGSYWTLSAQIIELKGAVVQVGSGTFEPASKALALQVVLAAQAAADTAQAAADTAQAASNTATAAALAAIQAVLVTLNPTAAAASAGPVTAASTALGATVAALGAAATALGAAVTAIGAGAVTIPAKSAQVG